MDISITDIMRTMTITPAQATLPDNLVSKLRDLLQLTD